MADEIFDSFRGPRTTKSALDERLNDTIDLPPKHVVNQDCGDKNAKKELRWVFSAHWRKQYAEPRHQKSTESGDYHCLPPKHDSNEYGYLKPMDSGFFQDIGREQSKCGQTEKPTHQTTHCDGDNSIHQRAKVRSSQRQPIEPP